MTVVVTVRDVPEQVRDALAEEARCRGRSLQAHLLGVLEQQARFSGNRRILADIERELAAGGGAGPDAPDAADLIRAERPGEGG
ncbi:FitA-like ribbon-helix-helix domain-containing protein [Nocardiopsis potens]|uniref:FitA-like ribbon-helix-helix domain-containing protein n=1 Tax=Nocardiopsis potens TaxID=1246458 RepID=UPI00034991CC|nr:hypothetical protein [Nocardiopsis potens]